MMPDLTLFYMSIYGGFGYTDDGYSGSLLSLAKGIAQTGNPPFSVVDFLAFYPKFGGTPLAFTGTITSGSAIVSVSPLVGLTAGQLVTGQGIPNPTTILSVGSGQITLSSNATANGTSFNAYTAPMVPIVVMQNALNLANASLMQSRWREQWQFAMCLYMAHVCTLYMGTESGPNTTASQVAGSGLENGIVTATSVGGVSLNAQLVGGLEKFGEFNLTRYGVQLASKARVIGAGMTYIR
jgi:hypothetical protein